MTKPDRGTVWTVAVPFAALALVVAAVAVDRVTPNPTASADPPVAVVVPVNAVDARPSYQVTVRPQFSRAAVVEASADGVVTRVLAQSGQQLRSGDPVVEVNDQPIMAMQSAAPLYRDLGFGEAGADVRRLTEFLVSLDYLAGPPRSVVDDDVVDAIRRFNAEQGRSDLGGAFEVRSVAWIGPDPFVVNEVLAEVGARLVGAAPVVRGRRVLDSLAVVEPPDGIPPVDGGYAITVVGTTVAYDAGAGLVTGSAGLAALDKVVAEDIELVGIVAAAQPQPVLRVPSSSVVVDEDGSTCVYADRDDAPTGVTVSGGELWTADLAPVDGLDTVLANPGEVLGELTCG